MPEHGAIGWPGERRNPRYPDQHESIVHRRKAGEGFKITRVRLEVRGKVAGLDQAGFAKAAEAAKNGCPVSTALQGNVQMELDAKLE